MTDDTLPRPPDAEASGKGKGNSWWKRCVWPVVVLVVIVVIFSNFQSDGNETPVTTDRERVVGPIELLQIESEMSLICGEDVNVLERIVLALTDTMQEIRQLDDEGLAAFIAMVPFLCDYWRDEGNTATARLIGDEAEMEAWIDGWIARPGEREEFNRRYSRALEQLRETDLIRGLLR